MNESIKAVHLTHPDGTHSAVSAFGAEVTARVIAFHEGLPEYAPTPLADLKRLAATQRQLLERLWPTLKPGGRLLYTTCTILPAENQDNIRAFLVAHPDARLQTLALPACTDTGYGSLHLPDDDGDGFYYALLHKSPA